MSTSSEVEAYLDYYLNPQNESDFAIMLDGPWGSGKTHFLNAYMGKRHEEAKKSVSNARPTYLYASLYGVRSTAQITEQFFAQAHPVLNSKVVRLVGTTLSRFLNGFAGTDVNSGSENSEIIKDMVLKLDGKVLVFDDLERCAMPIAEVMGFINGFVEHDHLKVIVVANEAEIPVVEKPEYERKKEKLVGKTLRVGSDPSVVFELFVEKMHNQAAKEAAIKAKAAALHTFTASGKQNLRSLRAVLTDYDRLVATVDPSLQKADEALSRILLYIVATGLEFRAGNLSAKNLEELNSSMMWIGYDLEDQSQKIAQAEHLKNTYPDVFLRDPIVPSHTVSQLFSSGIIDVTAVNEHLREHPLVVGPEGTPAWRRLWHWDELTRTQYEAARSQLIDELNHHKLTHPGIILHAAGEVLRFAELGDNFLGDGVDIVEFFLNYTEKLLEYKSLIPAPKLFGYHSGSYASLSYYSESMDDFRKIKEALARASQIAFSRKMEKEAQSLFSRLKSGDATSYSSLYEYGEEGQHYADAELLHYIDVSDFADLLIVDSCPNDHLFATMKYRYENEAQQKRLVAEHEWVRELHRELVKRASNELPPYGRLLEARVGKFFGNIETNLSSSD